MAKYLVETYYTCFKVNHYLDDINETKNLEKRDDPNLKKSF